MRRRKYSKKKKGKPHRINERIRVSQVRVVDENKNQMGVFPVGKARDMAKERGLDLVEVAPKANPPVCRLMDYGKYLYDLHKREHEAKKHQKQIQVKEIKFRPKISDHDYNFKVRHVQKFLKDGNKVKITVMLRGREKAKPELGYEILDRVKADVGNLGKQDGKVNKQPWAVSTLLSPAKSGGKDAQTKDSQRSQKEVQDNS